MTGEMISVDMDGQWLEASAPNWLETEGVSTCIAVAVADDERQQAWLIHSGSFGHDANSLKQMLSQAASVQPSGLGLNVCIFGGEAGDADFESEAERARQAVAVVVGDLIPEAKVTYRWREGGDIEVIFEDGAWKITHWNP
jgi:hypothetical protein